MIDRRRVRPQGVSWQAQIPWSAARTVGWRAAPGPKSRNRDRQMYTEYLGIKEKPFSILPDPDFLLWTPGHSLAYSMLEYGILKSFYVPFFCQK